ncbi:uncharacterized protein LOC143036355 [Oratosquilla oratoria]|uniref:uncharacterized protein LOC143036355 n=1 Tax=Oratosquilla oratoria TaxID=337810 RepID=UPI003F75ABFE
MDEVKDLLLSGLVKLKLEHKLEEVMKCLEDVGVDRADELRLIKDINLHAALKPIKARALMETWTAQDKSSVDDNRQVVNEASSPLQLIPRTPLWSIVPDSQSPSPSAHCATWPSTDELTFEDMEDRPKEVRKAVHRVLKHGGTAELSPRDRRAIIRHVVAKVLQVHPKPYRCHMVVIAKKVIDIFPCLKDAQVAGTSIGRGYDSVLNQLVARVETERHGQYKIKRIAEDSDSEEATVIKKSSYGPTNRLPDPPPPEEQSGPEFEYYHQRVMIMKGCSIFVLKDKWPALFTAEALDGHFQQLMGFSCQGRMLEAFGEKQQLIVDSFEEESRVKSKLAKKLRGRLRGAKKACEEVGNQLPYQAATITLIMAYFQEEKESLFRVAETDRGTRLPKNTMSDCKHLAVDEMIVKYYGHHALKQFIRGKPIRFGYKFWALCGVSGYCYNFDLYCGNSSSDDKHADLLLGSKVVLNMLDVVEEP